MKVFISHSSRDRWVAKRISSDLNSLGAKTFLDEKDLDTGVSLDETISDHLKHCDEFLVLLSPAAIKSHWVLLEVGGAKALNKRIISILLNIGANEIPYPLSKHLARDINDIDKYYNEVKERISGRASSTKIKPMQKRKMTPKPVKETFKVGDKVRLPYFRPHDVVHNGILFNWTNKMDSYMAQIGTITEIDSDKTALLDIDSGKHWWPLEWLVNYTTD